MQQLKKGFPPHTSQVFNTLLPVTTTFSVKDTQRTSLPSHSTYDQCVHPHPLQQHKPELFAKNVNYNRNSENTLTTVLALPHNRHRQYDDKFQDFNYSGNGMNVDVSNHADDEQKAFGICKRGKREDDENFDSFMDTDNENNPIRMT